GRARMPGGAWGAGGDRPEPRPPRRDRQRAAGDEEAEKGMGTQAEQRVETVVSQNLPAEDDPGEEERPEAQLPRAGLHRIDRAALTRQDDRERGNEGEEIGPPPEWREERGAVEHEGQGEAVRRLPATAGHGLHDPGGGGDQRCGEERGSDR